MFDVRLQFAPRLIAEHFGRHKYSTTTKALGELVANAFDAGARLVDVMVHENDLGGIDSIVVWDIGRLHLSRLDWRVSRPSGQPTRGADGLCDSQV
jgi:hypothetical protein